MKELELDKLVWVGGNGHGSSVSSTTITFCSKLTMTFFGALQSETAPAFKVKPVEMHNLKDWKICSHKFLHNWPHTASTLQFALKLEQSPFDHSMHAVTKRQSKCQTRSSATFNGFKQCGCGQGQVQMCSCQSEMLQCHR